MTQLDRLEALAKEYDGHPANIVTSRNVWEAWDALPDLIRVARAAKKYMSEGEGPDAENWFEIQRCLDLPLFAEVES